MDIQIGAGDVVIIKVGTNVLVACEDGRERLDKESFRRIGKQVKQLSAMGVRVTIVTSAAITAGMVTTGIPVRPDRATQVNELQRLASIGGRIVYNAWADAIDPLIPGELLVTRAELSDRAHAQERKEALRTIRTLWEHGDVPILNENDAITHEEITFGDNDMLAALVASRLNANPDFNGRTRLVILSDVNGVYGDVKDAGSMISQFSFNDEPSIQVGSVGSNGTGGIASKIAAARFAAERGVDVCLTNGRVDNALLKPQQPGLGTRFSFAVE